MPFDNAPERAPSEELSLYERLKILRELVPKSGNQAFLVLLKYGPPLFLGPQVDEVLGVEKAGVVRAIVRPAGLTHHVGHFRELREH